jgi:hypothetical protein
MTIDGLLEGGDGLAGLKTGHYLGFLKLFGVAFWLNWRTASEGGPYGLFGDCGVFGELGAETPF